MASQVKFPPAAEEKDGFGGATQSFSNPLDEESSSQKFWRKMKEQPFVPIGSFATCGALIAASHYLRTGNRENFQRALRWRVGLQGITVVAAVLGTVYLGSGSPAKPTESNGSIATQPGRPATVAQTAKLEERRAEERAQLQARLREAELREEREEKRRAEQVLLAGSASDAQRASRPMIGQDRRDRSGAPPTLASSQPPPQADDQVTQAFKSSAWTGQTADANDPGERRSRMV